MRWRPKANLVKGCAHAAGMLKWGKGFNRGLHGWRGWEGNAEKLTRGKAEILKWGAQGLSGYRLMISGEKVLSFKS